MKALPSTPSVSFARRVPPFQHLSKCMRAIARSGGQRRFSSSGLASLSCARMKGMNSPTIWRASSFPSLVPHGIAFVRLCFRPPSKMVVRQRQLSTWAYSSARLSLPCWSRSPLRSGSQARPHGAAFPNGAHSVGVPALTTRSSCATSGGSDSGPSFHGVDLEQLGRKPDPPDCSGQSQLAIRRQPARRQTSRCGHEPGALGQDQRARSDAHVSD